MKKLLTSLLSLVTIPSFVTRVASCEIGEKEKVITDLTFYQDSDIGFFDSIPNDEAIVQQFNEQKNLTLILNIDVTVENIDNQKATIIAVPDSLIVKNSATVKFVTTINLNDYKDKNDLGAFRTVANEETIIAKFSKINNINLTLANYVDIKEITDKDALIIAKEDQDKKYVSGKINVKFTVQKDLSISAIKYLGDFLEKAPTEQQVLNMFNDVNIKNNPNWENLTLENDVNIKRITNNNAIIEAKPESKWSKGNVTVDFDVMNIKEQDTIFINKEGQIETSTSDNHTLIKDKRTTEIIQIGFYTNDVGITEMVKMPKIVEKVPNYLPKKITSLEKVFASVSVFNQDISNWNVSNVTNMNEMFRDAKEFNQNISNWDVSKVNSMSEMFRGTKEFNNGGKELAWKNKTKNISNLNYMFYGASKFNQDVSNWDVSNVIKMRGMFRDASSFNNRGNKLTWNENTDKIEDISEMFWNAISFNQDISNWNTSEVTNMNNTFNGASKFNQNIGDWNVNKVNNMEQMFMNASKFNQNLHNWTPKKGVKHKDFDTNSGFADKAELHPQWT